MKLTARQGRLNIHLRVFQQGPDLQVLCGGGASHLGAVALAAPDKRHVLQSDSPQLSEQANLPEQVEARVLSLPGHKESDLALRMAQSMAEALHCAVCVSAGIHYDNITRTEIEQVEQMVQDLTQRCIAALAKDL